MKGKPNTGAYLKKWLGAFAWCCSQKKGFVHKEFLAANPRFKKAGNNLYLRQMVEIGLLVTIPISRHRYLYVPRAVYTFCGHVMLGDGCLWCAQARKDRIGAIRSEPIEIGIRAL